jgi:hypothetical protein
MIAGFWEEDEPLTQGVCPQEVQVLCSSPRFSSRSPAMLEVFISNVIENVWDIAVKTAYHPLLEKEETFYVTKSISTLLHLCQSQ